MSRTALALASVAVFSSIAASAHDFWIEPSTFHPAAGATVAVALRVGQKLRGDPLPRIPMLIDRFVLRGASGETPVIGRTGADPAGYARVPDAGLYWIGYQSNPYSVTLEAKLFESYLKEEGLERIIESRARRGESPAAGRERFYRCAKSLLAVGDGSGGFDVPLGFTLELVPRKRPDASGPLPLSLFFRGKPLAGVLVVAMNKDDADHPVRARTDARGRVTLRLPRAGFWLIKAVHMERAPSDAGVDWESWWASITFETLGERASRPRATGVSPGAGIRGRARRPTDAGEDARAPIAR